MATWLLRPCRGGKGNKNFSNLTQRALKVSNKIQETMMVDTYLDMEKIELGSDMKQKRSCERK
ncbi:hypothetical protein YC2023_070529 [Brassica napus]